MKALILSSSNTQKASTKYRFEQYQDILAARGITANHVRRNQINNSLLEKIPDYDVVSNLRCLIKPSQSKKIIRSSQRSIFDFDDAIYTRPGRPHSFITNIKVKNRLHIWLKEADIITTASNWLANYARQFSSSVVVVPMALDMDIWKPAKQKNEDCITIGWSGAPGNVPNLERLDNVLTRIIKQHPFVRLSVFSGKKPELSCPFNYHPFSHGAEADFGRQLDIGLLPLVEDEFSSGKSPIKAIQYLASGVPVIGNVFGATTEILNDSNSLSVKTDDDWMNAITMMIENRERISTMGKAARAFAVKHHDIRTVGQQLVNIYTNKI